ncbi:MULTISPECIES: hypothetical protein [unclassified Peribacillus]|uniref:hypothetical protein n=1 Tax=unclassified Peribacillus TaxID=2675266 RepID=UPI00366F6CD6
MTFFPHARQIMDGDQHPNMTPLEQKVMQEIGVGTFIVVKGQVYKESARLLKDVVWGRAAVGTYCCPICKRPTEGIRVVNRGAKGA